MPMEKSLCPDCKDMIGGTSHQMLNTNRRMEPSEVQERVGKLRCILVIGLYHHPSTTDQRSNLSS